LKLIDSGQIDNAIRRFKNASARLIERRESQSLVELTDYKARLDLIHDKKISSMKDLLPILEQSYLNTGENGQVVFLV
jgi:hypothetical protein